VETDLPRLRRRLVAWYGRHARDLPWRGSRDAYRVWISEIMLQQTTVVAVVPYFERFLARFPDVAALAVADEQDVLRLWEGLGYYSRARNLHKAARLVVERHAGRFPEDVGALQELPGVGRYTAGAIASFAYDRRAPIVEANTLRLYARLLGYRGDPRSSAGQKILWEFAERVLPRDRPGRFNQALMDLGAKVCTPVEPDCASCPVQSCCAAFAGGLQREIPLAAKRPEATELTHAAVAVHHAGKWLLRQCGPDERWAGLWDFPRIDVTAFAGQIPAGPEPAGAGIELPTELARTIEREVERLTGVPTQVGEVFHQLRHTVTRYRINLLCCRGTCRWETEGTALEASRNPPLRADVQWVATKELENLPLSMTGRKLAKQVQLLTPNASQPSTTTV